jgi:hypothetical protein
MVERSSRTFFETGGLMGTLRELSKSFLGPRPPLQGGMRYVQTQYQLIPQFLGQQRFWTWHLLTG